MPYEQLLLDGSSVTVYSPKEWFKLWSEHCYKQYEKDGELTGLYCCGYHWCCDECEMKHACGCDDCVQTMIDILESFGFKPDYSDIDFDALEERIKKMYETKNRR